jgi:hypothetical protein
MSNYKNWTIWVFNFWNEDFKYQRRKWFKTSKYVHFYELKLSKNFLKAGTQNCECSAQF